MQHLLEEVHPSRPCPIFHHDNIVLIQLDRHWMELRERTYSLPHNCASKHDKYEPCKQAVVPVFVKTPCDTENLENEEGRGGMFCKERSGRRDRDIKRVLPVKRQQVRNTRWRQSSRFVLRCAEPCSGFELVIKKRRLFRWRIWKRCEGYGFVWQKYVYILLIREGERERIKGLENSQSICQERRNASTTYFLRNDNISRM